MIVASIPAIRRASWELFFYLHQIVILCLLVLFIYHSSNFVYYATIPFVLYAADKLLRWFSIYSKRCFIRRIERFDDLLRIEAERGNIRYQLRKARSGAELCRLSLCQIVGAEPGTRLLLTDTLPAVAPPALPETSVEARPELHLLEHRIEAGEQQVRMARADMLPTVGLTAGYSYYGNIKLQGLADAGDGTAVPYTQEFRDGLGLAMVAVKIPIFHWGESRKKVRKARFELRNAQLDLQKNTRLMSLEVEQAIRNVEDGYRMIQTAELALRQAEENLRVMRNRHAAQMAPLTDLLDAQSQWQQAASNRIEAQTQYRIYQTEYLRASGRLE